MYIYIGGLIEYISKKVAAYGQFVLVWYIHQQENMPNGAKIASNVIYLLLDILDVQPVFPFFYMICG